MGFLGGLGFIFGMSCRFGYSYLARGFGSWAVWASKKSARAISSLNGLNALFNSRLFHVKAAAVFLFFFSRIEPLEFKCSRLFYQIHSGVDLVYSLSLLIGILKCRVEHGAGSELD